MWSSRWANWQQTHISCLTRLRLKKSSRIRNLVNCHEFIKRPFPLPNKAKSTKKGSHIWLFAACQQAGVQHTHRANRMYCSYRVEDVYAFQKQMFGLTVSTPCVKMNIVIKKIYINGCPFDVLIPGPIQPSDKKTAALPPLLPPARPPVFSSIYFTCVSVPCAITALYISANNTHWCLHDERLHLK